MGRERVRDGAGACAAWALVARLACTAGSAQLGLVQSHPPQHEPSLRARKRSPLAASAVGEGWSTVRWCKKAWQDWYDHCATSAHHAGRGTSSMVASTSRIMPRMASASPSGAEPVATCRMQPPLSANGERRRGWDPQPCRVGGADARALRGAPPCSREREGRALSSAAAPDAHLCGEAIVKLPRWKALVVLSLATEMARLARAGIGQLAHAHPAIVQPARNRGCDSIAPWRERISSHCSSHIASSSSEVALSRPGAALERELDQGGAAWMCGPERCCHRASQQQAVTLRLGYHATGSPARAVHYPNKCTIPSIDMPL